MSRQIPTVDSFSRQPPRGRSGSLAGEKMARQFGRMSADQNPSRTALSDAARVREVAQICALGLIRLVTAQSSKTSPTVAHKDVAAGTVQSMCANEDDPHMEAA
jgi:hypothetical protein